MRKDDEACCTHKYNDVSVFVIVNHACAPVVRDAVINSSGAHLISAKTISSSKVEQAST